MAQEKKLTDRTLSGFLWMITGGGIQVLLKVGVLAVLGRLISPEEFGLVSMAAIAVEFSKMFTQMGVGPALVQRKELETRHLTTGFSLSLLMGLTFGGLLALGAPLLAMFFKMPGLTHVLRVISLIFLIDSLTLIGQALMQRSMKFKMLAAIDIASYIIGYGATGITLGYLGWGVWALVCALMAQATLQALLVVIFQPFPKKLGFDQQAFKELLHFGGGFTIARIGNYLAVQGDNMVVGKMLGSRELGIYGRAYQFMVMPANLFGSTLDSALFPAMSQVQDDKQRLGRAFLTGVGFIALVGIPLSVIMVLLAPEIVQVLLGPKWTAVTVPFQILACGLLFRMNYKICDTLVRAAGAVYQRALRQVAYAVLVLAGSYIGQFWGLNGVACGVAFALTVNFFLMAQLSVQLSDVTWLDIAKAHRHGLLLGITTGITTSLLVNFCRQHIDIPIVTLLISGAGAGAQLIAATWFFPNFFIKEDQQALLNKLIPKKFQRKNSSKPKKPANTIATIKNEPFPPLTLIQSLLSEFHKEGIRYCQWKGNDHLSDTLNGKSDLDILFDNSHKPKLEILLARFGFRKFDVIWQKRHAGIEDYIGLDPATGTLVHLHSYFRLTVGKMFLKPYQLNLEEKVLSRRIFNEESGIYTADPAMELVLLIFSEALTIRMRDRTKLALSRKNQFSDKVLHKFQWLKQQISSPELEVTLQELVAQPTPILKFVFSELNPRQLQKLASLLRKEFRNNRLNTSPTAFMERWYREASAVLAQQMASKFEEPVKTKRTNPRGGIIISLNGAAREERSPLISALKKSFQQKLDVYSLSIGKAGRARKLLRRVEKMVGSGRKKASQNLTGTVNDLPKNSHIKNFHYCLEALLIADEKRRRQQLMLKAKRKGMLVIINNKHPDRLPPFQESPRLQHLANSSNPAYRAMAKMEAQIHARAGNFLPDLTFLLQEDTKPENIPRESTELKMEEQTIRAQISENKIIQVNAGMPKQDMLTQIKNKIWEAYP
jgi:O-antigen/teichoic acid export membrane protein